MPRAGLLLLSSLLCVAPMLASAEEKALRIQFVNGKNGKPLSNTLVVVNRNTLPPEKNHLSTSVLRTDKDGIVEVKANPGERIMANPDRSFGRNCQTNGSYGPNYETTIVFQDGIVEENHCGPKLPPPQPGLLVVVFRRETFLEALGDD